MVNMEVEIISNTSISPFSPTSSCLKTYKFSLLDQFIAPAYFATILFYQTSQEAISTTQRSVLLKQSLSESLTRFFPLAGRVKGQFSIHCNDEGVSYVEAIANIPLSRYLIQPDLKLLSKLLPNVTTESELVLIQETTFACGGFAVGLYVSHSVCDANSLVLFLKDWATTARKSPTKQPFLDGESIFPQYTPFPREATILNTIYSPFIRKGKNITKRIVFKESAIANLKTRTSSGKICNPTRAEVVTALLSKCLMVSYKNKTSTNIPLAINHAVNFRRRLEPPLPECSVGNFVGTVGTVFTDTDKELSEFVSKLRQTIKKIDNHFLQKIKSGEDGFFKYYDKLKEIKDMYNSPLLGGGPIEFAGFSSWLNFGVYDIDFGCGKPIWVVGAMPHTNDPDFPMFNLNNLMDTRTGKGVEAWVTIKEDTFEFLKEETELLQYASFDPSPFCN